MKAKGIISAMVTPMTSDEKIDVKGIRKLVDILISAKVNGIFCLGTTGEFYAMSTKEKELVVDTVVDQAGGRVHVYAGAGAVSTREVITLSNMMEKLGAVAVSVVTPYFICPDQRQLIDHYERIAGSTKLPIILYNIPSRTGVHLEPETVAKLAGNPNIIAIKDSSGKFENIEAYLEKTRELDFDVLAGTDMLICRTLEKGGSGAVAATTNIFPELIVSIYDSYMKGDIEKARVQQQKLAPLAAGLKMGTVPGVLKQAASIAGMPSGQARMPVTGLSGSELEKLEKIIKEGDFS